MDFSAVTVLVKSSVPAVDFWEEQQVVRPLGDTFTNTQLCLKLILWAYFWKPA